MPENNVPATPAVVAKPTIGQAIEVIFGSRALQTLLIVGFIGFSVVAKYMPNTPVTPVNPSPAPYSPAVQKTLADLVPPDARVKLADLYHGMAVYLHRDKPRKEGEKHQIENIGEFYAFQNKAAQGFQNMTGIVNLTSVRAPIDQKLRTATGVLASSKSLDDPATNVRTSLVYALKQISEELSPEYKNVSLDFIN